MPWSAPCSSPAARQITVPDLPESLQVPAAAGRGEGTVPPASAPAGSLEAIERASILKALDQTGWNKQAAAALLGLRRPTLYSKLRKHRIPQRPGRLPERRLPAA